MQEKAEIQREKPIRSITVPSPTVTSETDAPNSRSNCTLSACPLRAAMCRAVMPPSAGWLIIWDKALKHKIMLSINHHKHFNLEKTFGHQLGIQHVPMIKLWGWFFIVCYFTHYIPEVWYAWNIVSKKKPDAPGMTIWSSKMKCSPSIQIICFMDLKHATNLWMTNKLLAPQTREITWKINYSRWLQKVLKSKQPPSDHVDKLASKQSVDRSKEHNDELKIHYEFNLETEELQLNGWSIA